jgi:glycosyltransferase involved in cell wall biosynthesis
VPVVATDHGGPPELVARAEPGTARLVPPGDAAELADAIVALLPARTSTAARQRRSRKLTLPPARFADLFRDLA